MKIIIEKSVTVITPTIGSSKLFDAVLSVQKQSYSNITHLVVADGSEYKDAAEAEIHRALANGSNKKIRMCVTPENTGKTGGNFYGHRIYAGYPHLINSDFIFFLDEDNWYDPDHVASLVDVLERGNEFAYSFRKIYNPDKSYVCDDNCEALGKWPIYFSHKEPQYLIDTSAFAFQNKFIQKSCHLWHSGWGGDRRYFYSVKDHVKWDTNHKHTLCYRLDGNPGSVNEEFFIKGNKEQLEHYNGELPWLKT